MSSARWIADEEAVDPLCPEVSGTPDVSARRGYVRRRALALMVVPAACAALFGFVHTVDHRSLFSVSAESEVGLALVKKSFVVQSRHSGRCLDWTRTIIFPWPCNNSVTQQWAFVERRRLVAQGAQCLDAGGEQVHVWKCDMSAAGEGHQRWAYDEEHGMVKHFDKCLEESTPKGVWLYLRPCNVSNPHQRFSLREKPLAAPEEPDLSMVEPENARTEPLQIRHSSGLCVDAANEGLRPRPCDSNMKSQSWLRDIFSGQIRNLAGGCLDPANVSRTVACRESDQTQGWAFDAGAGQIQWREKNQCLSLKEPSEKRDGLTMKPCGVDVFGSQQWGFVQLPRESKGSEGGLLRSWKAAKGAVLAGVVGLGMCVAVTICGVCCLLLPGSPLTVPIPARQQRLP